MMLIRNKYKLKRIAGFAVFAAVLVISLQACKSSEPLQSEMKKQIPSSYVASEDTLNSAQIDYKVYFKDPYLLALIDSALVNNQELNILLQEIEMEKSEVRARKGEYLPSIGLMAGAGTEKPGRYTRNGAVEANTEIRDGKEFPEPLNDYMVGAYASWEVDVWKKLRNAKKSAVLKYLSSIEGRNYMRTLLISEIASSYYELLALDNQLIILRQNIELQQKALTIVKLEKEAAQVTELAVRRFEAEVAKNKSYQFMIQQEIVALENRLNFLVGRYPQVVERSREDFEKMELDSVYAGIPSQLIQNRPDIRQSELRLEAAHLDVKSARASFYPSVSIDASIGYQAYQTAFLFQSPASMLFGVAGNLMAPLVNRNAIKAAYIAANAKQQAVLVEYEQTLLNAFTEVSTQIAKVQNLQQSYDLKLQQVDALNRSIAISIGLFKSARADYMEVLLTQREALEAKVELIETKQEQLKARVVLYQALGGG